MPTILEILTAQPKPWWEHWEEPRPLPWPVPQTVPLDINNVAKYIAGTPTRLAAIAHLPLTPPWEQTWVEYRSVRLDARDDHLAFVVTRREVTHPRQGGPPEEVRWELLWSPVQRFEGRRGIEASAQFLTYLYADGTPVQGDPRPEDEFSFLILSAVPAHALGIDSEVFTAYIHDIIFDFTVVYFAFALLNCKNVVIEDQVTPPKLAAKRLKKHGVPSITRKVLRVVPLQVAHRRLGEQAPLDHSPKALHIRRGYFGDYREGRGLFGKYHGVYWWDQAIRGSRAAGEVVKSYELEQPEGVS